MWVVTEHKLTSAMLELNVRIMVREIADAPYATYADPLIDRFKARLKEMPRTNAYSAEYFYKAVEVDLKTVEIWKTDSQSNLKRKMFTLKYKNEE